MVRIYEGRFSLLVIDRFWTMTLEAPVTRRYWRLFRKTSTDLQEPRRLKNAMIWRFTIPELKIAVSKCSTKEVYFILNGNLF